MKKKLLIIEDEISLGKQLKWGLSDAYDVVIATDVPHARALISSREFPVITLDLGLPPSPDTPQEGFLLLEAIPALAPYTKVIVITGNTEHANAIKAIGLGATDFCTKPIDHIGILRIILERTFNIYELEEANRSLEKSCKEKYSLCGIMGISPVMEELFKLTQQVSNTGYPVLIQGESGTGKEMVARAIYALSSRAQKPLVIINCGAIPENLMESELFGHEKGAFTGATGTKIGKMEMADDGTVFLDEIGDMPLALQVKLLRFLQEGTVERVGGTKTVKLDVRVIAATNVDLGQAVKQGRFREDLFYRLNVVPIIIPPLRSRQEDILFLAHHFIKEEAQRLQRSKVTLSQEAAAALTTHTWPGNVRELKNNICRAMTINADGVIKPADMGLSAIQGCVDPCFLTIREARDTAERQAIQHALAATGNNITKAAKLLGITRPTLHDLLKKLGMDKIVI